VSSKSGASVDGIRAVALLTRPETELDDKKLNCKKIDAGTFEIKDFSVQKFGRYIIRLKISDESNDTKYLDIYGYRANK
jgi:nitrogen fixation protein FixH